MGIILSDKINAHFRIQVLEEMIKKLEQVCKKWKRCQDNCNSNQCNKHNFTVPRKWRDIVKRSNSRCAGTKGKDEQCHEPVAKQDENADANIGQNSVQSVPKHGPCNVASVKLPRRKQIQKRYEQSKCFAADDG